MIAGFALTAFPAEYSYIVSGTPVEPTGISDVSDPTEVTLALRTLSPSPRSDLEARGRTIIEMLLSTWFRSTTPTGFFLLLK